MLSKADRYKLVDTIFSDERLLKEAAKTLYGTEDEAYDLTKRELQIVLSDATEYEISRLCNVCESVKGPSEYTNVMRKPATRNEKEDHGGDDFPQGATRAPQKRQQKRVANADNPLSKDHIDEE